MKEIRQQVNANGLSVILICLKGTLKQPKRKMKSCKKAERKRISEKKETSKRLSRKKKKKRRKPEKNAHYRCKECGYQWHEKPRPAACSKCGCIWVEWLNFKSEFAK